MVTPKHLFIASVVILTALILTGQYGQTCNAPTEALQAPTSDASSYPYIDSPKPVMSLTEPQGES